MKKYQKKEIFYYKDDVFVMKIEQNLVNAYRLSNECFDFNPEMNKCVNSGNY